MKRIRILGAIVVLALMVGAGPAFGQEATPEAISAEPTLLLYSTVGRMLGGDMSNAVTPATVDNDLLAFPADWAVVGVGTTNQPLRSGEMMPGGTAGDLHYWWADPSSASHADIIDFQRWLILLPTPAADATPDAAATPYVDFNPEFPFLALAIADPDSAVVLHAQNVADFNAWLKEMIQAEDITLAGIQVSGTFGQVKTSVSYNIPRTGLDLSGGYVGAAHFYFGDYPSGEWIMNGLYASDSDVQPLIATGTETVHLHGYQPDTMLGGHIGSAAAVDVAVTLYPLKVVDRELDTPAPTAP